MNNNNKNNCYKIVPSTDIYENKGSYIIKSDVPGVEKDGIDVKLEDRVLFLSGKVKKDVLPYECNNDAELYYERSFKINDEIDTEKIIASLKNGVLTVELPKLVVEPKKIEVSAA